jgi:hypothetical protein
MRVHLRTFISVLLILALLPTVSLAAVCDLSCTLMPKAHSNPRSEASTHENIAAQHHHHDHAAPHLQGGSPGSAPHTISANHGCCTGVDGEFSEYCADAKGFAPQEKRAVTNSGIGFVHVGVPVLLIVDQEPRHRHSGIPKALVLNSSSCCIPLRI